VSDSFEEMSDEQLGVQDDLEALRDVLACELQAISQYEEHLLYLENEEASSAMERIIEQEKEHVAELLRLIQTLDPVQGEKLRKIL
jgi:rubrerythrin